MSVWQPSVIIHSFLLLFSDTGSGDGNGQLVVQDFSFGQPPFLTGEKGTLRLSNALGSVDNSNTESWQWCSESWVIFFLSLKVLKALQEAVTNHNLAVQQNPLPPDPTPPNATPVKTPVRLLPVNSFQVNCSGELRHMGNSHPWPCEKLFFSHLSRWRCWGMADRRCLWM